MIAERKFLTKEIVNKNEIVSAVFQLIWLLCFYNFTLQLDQFE